MGSEYFEIVIDETGRQNLKQERPQRFNTEKKRCNTLEEVRQFLIERYGKMPQGRNKIYVDGANNEAVEVGFTHSFWNYDISHNSSKWYQTDWISVYKIQREAVNVLTQQLALAI